MNFNPLATGKAFVAFVIGTVAMYMMFGMGESSIVNIMLNIFDSMLLIPAETWNSVKPIIWIVVLIFAIMAVIVTPIWIYFDEDQKSGENNED